MLAAGVALLGAGALTTEARAQAVDPNLGFRDKAVPASTPNISGIWKAIPGTIKGASNSGRDVTQMDGTPVPMLPWVRKIFEERLAAEKKGELLFDPNAACLPAGVPRMLPTFYPLEIIQTPDFVIFLHEAQHNFRMVRMNGKHAVNPKPTYMGDSIGHWEGGDLIVDTIGLVPHTQINEGGIVHSDALHVSERWHPMPDHQMELVYTIDDPKAFAKPWSVRDVFRLSPELQNIEYVCEENNRNAPDAKGMVHAALK